MTTKISLNNIQSAALTQLGTAVPKISSVAYVGDNTAADTAGGETVTINGSGFAAGATVYLGGNVVSVVTVVSSTQITFTSPAKSAGSYTLYVINTDGGTAIYVPGVNYSGVPTWSNAAGSLGTQYEYTSINQTFVATGDAPITYSLVSGSLPTGSTLFGNGILSGTAPASAGSTTYSFTIRATDAQNQDTDRAFSLTINTDVVTWSSPADLTAYSVSQNLAIANVTLAASSAAGFGVTYAANALPTGLSVSGNVITGTPTTIQTVSTLLTATANTTGKSATRTISWTVSLALDVNWSYNSLLLSADSTLTTSSFVTDAGTNNFQLTVAGDTRAQNFNPNTPGYYSAYFGTRTDYISLSAVAALTTFTGDFTFEAWVCPTDTSVSNWSIWDSRQSGSTSNPMVFSVSALASPVSGQGRLMYFNGSYNYGTGTVYYNQWTHVAFVRIGSTMTFYVNGVAGGTATVSGTQTGTATTNPIYIGSKDTGAGASYGIVGHISNFRIVNGTGVYTTNFTPSTAPLTAVANTVLLTCQSNRFIDNSTNNYTLTTSGTLAIKPANPLTANVSYAAYGSGYFDGTGDYLSVANNVGFQFGTGDFTVECWINKPSAANGSIVDVRAALGAEPWAFYVDGSNYPYFYDGTTYTSTVAIVSNAWNHVAVVRTSGVLKIFVNGVQGYSASYTTSLNATGTLTIGGTAAYTTGYISNLRIVKGTAVYTAAFTPPTAPLTAVANTSLLTLQYNGAHNNSTFSDNSNFNNLVTRNGNSTVGTFSPYGNNWSNYFDGTGDYLIVADNAALQLSTGSFTIEFWIYFNSIASYQTVYDKGYTNAGGLVIQTGNGTGRLIVYIAGSAVITESGTGTIGTWIHYALVRNGTALALYRNGTSSGTATNSTNLNDTSTLGIGAGGSASVVGQYPINGYMSNLRVVKGTAMYTGAFTPSTSPLTAVANTQLLTCQSNRLIDNSPNNFALTKNGDVAVQKFSPFSSVTVPAYYSNYFDGTGDCLTVDSATGNFTGDFTIEGWYYWTSFASYQTLFALYTNNYYIQNTASGGSTFAASADFGIGTVLSNASLNTWYHIAICRTGSTLSSFVNGTRTATVTKSGTLGTTGNTVIIGAQNTTQWSFYGYISNFRTVKGTDVYGASNTTITVPTAPLTTVANTSLLTCQSSTLIDNSTNSYAVTVVGDTKPLLVSPFTPTANSAAAYSPTIFSGSMYFDGTGDYLGITGLPAFGTGDFTIDGWVYNTGGTTNRGVFSLAGSVLSTSVGISLAYYSNGGGWQYSYAGSSTTTVTTTLLVNTWYHFAFSRSSGTLKIYINGAQIASLSDTTNYTFNALTVGGYYSTSQLLIGYVSDMRVIPGVALYTSAFYPGATPSTAVGTKPGTTAVYNSSVLLNGTGSGIIDATRTNTFETVGDVRVTTSTSPYAGGGSSYYFDGTGDYLNISDNQPLEPGSGNLTWEMWIKTTNSTQYATLYSRTPSAFATGMWSLMMNMATATTGDVGLYVGDYNVSSPLLQTTGVSVRDGNWHHIAVVRNGSSWVLYVDGTSRATGTWSGTIANIAYGPWVGKDQNYGRDYTGYIADLRITTGYARYTTAFTAPTTPLLVK